MTLAVLYVPGSSQHLMGQSGSLIADRIARSLPSSLTGPEIRFRTTAKNPAYELASGITLDRVTVEQQVGQGSADPQWAPVLQLYELRYIEAFARPFSSLPPFFRFARAARIVWRELPKVLRASTRGDTPKGREDKYQAAFLGLINLVSVVSMLWWLALAVAAFLGIQEIFGDLTAEAEGALATAALVVAGLAAFRVAARDAIDAVEKSAVEFYAIMEFLEDPRPYAASTNAVFDALEVLKRDGHEPIDILAFSLGCLVTEEAIWPRRPRIASFTPDVANWITLGHPHELIASVHPDRFQDGDRAQPAVRVHRWINLVAADDFLGSEFEAESALHGRRPDLQLRFDAPSGWVPTSRLDRIVPFRRILNHTLYWDDKDARAPTCFDQVAAAAGWAERKNNASS